MFYLTFTGLYTDTTDVMRDVILLSEFFHRLKAGNMVKFFFFFFYSLSRTDLDTGFTGVTILF